MSTLKVQIGGNISQLEKALSTAQSRLKNFGSSLTSIGTTLSARVTAPLAALGGLAVKSAADFERLQQSMNVLNGSVEEGARNFERLKRFSATTPFQLQDLAKAQNMLQGFGLAADDAFESLSMIGDIAAITGGDINGIGIAFGQAAAEGRLMTRDIRQLINQGVPAIQLLADTMGVAQSEVLDLASEGEISFEILQQAFRDATTEGGMFANGMEQQSNTLAGVFSTLRDNVSIALGELGTTISETFNLKDVVRDLTASIQNIVTAFQNMSEESQKRIIKLAGLLAASGPIAIAIGQLAKIVVLFSKVVQTSFFKMVAPLVVFLALLKKAAELRGVFDPSSIAAWEVATFKAKETVKSMIGEMSDLAMEAFGVKDALDQLTGALGAETPTIGGEDGGGVTRVVKRLESAAIAAREFSAEYKSSLLGIGEVTSQAFQTVDVHLKKYPEAISEAMQQTKERAEQFAQGLHGAIQSATMSLFSGLGEMLSGTANFADVILRTMGSFASQLGKIVVGIGFAMLQLQPQNLFSNPFAAIAAGGALIALGAALRSLVSGGPGASAGAGTGGFERTATSVQQGGQVEFRISGDNLVGVLQNNSRNSGRVGRNIPLR